MGGKKELISLGASTAFIGFILSGPIGSLFVQFIQPQTPWTTAADFVMHYNAWQNIPYYFGFVLVGGMLILAAAHYRNIDDESEMDKMHILLSMIWTTIFATLIFFNYICQTTFIHHLATHYQPSYNTAIEILSMANPTSLSWAVEMWGYAILGVATWLLSSFYREKHKLIYRLLIANGMVSVGSAVLYTINASWLLTTIGLVGYALWNLLMVVLLILIYRYSKHLSDAQK
jgi:hypothetical protein